MSDYVSMRAIKLKTELLDPFVLRKVRDGSLTLQDLQGDVSPLREIYLQSYNYSQFPEDISKEAHEFIYETTNPQMTREAGMTFKKLCAWQ